jgi:hypothetical protein
MPETKYDCAGDVENKFGTTLIYLTNACSYRLASCQRSQFISRGKSLTGSIYIWFLLVQFFSGWTLPCRLSSWVNSRPKSGFPKDVLEWSKPISAASQVKESTKLIDDSEEIRKYFARGQTILDYFKAKLSDTSSKSEAGS